ncbi:GIY-YIG nuclease family protein [Streptomyces sp. NPDC001156]
MNVQGRMAWIYTLSDPRSGEVRYVGVTTRSLAERLRGHISDAGRQDHKSRWIRSLLKEGVSPVMTEIEAVPVEDHGEAEQRWIAAYRANGARLTNATDGGPGTLGRVASSETRERIRQAALERMKDPARRQAVSRVHKGKTIPESTKRAVSEAATKRWVAWRAAGSVTSDETRAKLSELAKARDLQPMNNPASRAKVAEAKQQWWDEWRAQGRPGRKTHCPQGHPYDDANTALEQGGNRKTPSRKCRACMRERARARRQAARRNP